MRYWISDAYWNNMLAINLVRATAATSPAAIPITREAPLPKAVTHQHDAMFSNWSSSLTNMRPNAGSTLRIGNRFGVT